MPQSRRSYVGLLAALLGGALFLVVHPSVELDGHLRTVRDADPETTREALRRLCWVRQGAEGLNELLPRLDIERRAVVLHEAYGLGCLEQLGPGLQAAYFLLETEEVERAAGFTSAAVGPALEILRTGDTDQRWRAARALALLDAHWSFEHRAQIEELVQTLTPGRELEELRAVTGVPGNADQEQEIDLGPREFVQDEVAAGEPTADAGMDDEPLVPALVPPTLAPPRIGVLYRGQQDSTDAGGAAGDEDMGSTDD